MRAKEYFKKTRKYFVLQEASAAAVLASALLKIFPPVIMNPLGLINLIIAGIAGYELKLSIKNSAILGILFFASVSWITPFLIPSLTELNDTTRISLLLVTAGLNCLMYALSVIAGKYIKSSRKSL